MRQCKHCNDTLFTDCYETCMTCYENHHTELLIEENLKLRMQVEDLESKIVKYSIDTLFDPENVPLKDWEGNPITHCQDCGEYWGYHHEEHCKGKLLDNADKHSKMYP